MTNQLIFNLNDQEQFPILQGMVKYLDTFTPYSELDKYWKKQYDPEKYNGQINEDAETLEQTTKDISRLIGKIKTSMIRMAIAQETTNYINKLLIERDLFAINIPGSDQREFNIKTYNRYVIEKVLRYCNFIQDRLEVNFHPHFKEPEKEKLGIKNSFGIWYEKFEVKDENEKIAITSNTQIKLQWKGQKNQLYNVLRQLKNDNELIGNSYNSLADFLIQNVTGFENNSKETIEKELKKNGPLPKPKRINVAPGEA